MQYNCFHVFCRVLNFKFLLPTSFQHIFYWFLNFNFDCLHFNICWLLNFVSLQDPSALSRAQEEVGSVLQGRLPRYDDVKELKYLTRCIYESMRLYPHPPVCCILCPSHTMWSQCLSSVYCLGLDKAGSNCWCASWKLQGQCRSRYNDISVQYTSFSSGNHLGN